VFSNVYQKKIDALNRGIELKSLPTPLLAPMIEEGLFQNQISKQIIANYLSDPGLQGIEGLILGCTHYPLIKNEVSEYYDNKLDIIDSSGVVAQSVKAFLELHHLYSKKQNSADHFMVSDITPSFESATKLFFGQRVPLEKYPLWE
jgi:glutamate racemase